VYSFLHTQNDRLYLLTGLALHIDRLHRQTARDTEESEGEVSEKDREAEGEVRKSTQLYIH